MLDIGLLLHVLKSMGLIECVTALPEVDIE